MGLKRYSALADLIKLLPGNDALNITLIFVHPLKI